MTGDHPSKDGNAFAKIVKIVIADTDQLSNSWFKDEMFAGVEPIEIEWFKHQKMNSKAE